MLLGILLIGRERHTIAIIQIDKMDSTTLDLMDVMDIVTKGGIVMPKFKVTFKEVYMPHEVERTCVVPSTDDVIYLYGLNEKDIEWYRIEEIL